MPEKYSDKLKDLVASGQLHKAIRSLLNFAKINAKDWENEITQLSYRFQNLENERRKNTIDITNFQLETNKLAQSFLEIVESFREANYFLFKKYPKNLNDIPPSPFEFVGRKVYLELLKSTLNEKVPAILLNGIGGIGKTTLVKKYTNLFENEYDHLVWVNIEYDGYTKDFNNQVSGFYQSIGNDKLLFENLDISFDTKQTITTRAEAILRALGKITGKNLLIIDNADSSLSNVYDKLPNYNHWSIIITSRQQIEPFTSIILDSLKPEFAEELFYKYFPAGLNFQNSVRKLLNLIGSHTLTVELLGRSCHVSPFSLSPGKILKKFEDQTVNKINNKVWIGQGKKEVEVYKYISSVFELSRLNQKEKSLIRQWAILPSSAITPTKILAIFDVQEKEVEEFETIIIQLSRKGWISFDTQNQNFRVHKIIQEIVRYELPPSINTCKKLLNGLINVLDTTDYEKGSLEKYKLIPFGESALKYLTEDHSMTVLLKARIGNLYVNAGQYNQGKIILEEIYYKNSSYLNFKELAIVRCNLGVVFWGFGEYQRGKDLLQSTLELVVQKLGMNHPVVTIQKNNLASIHLGLNEFHKAHELLSSALESAKMRLGPNHPEILIYQCNLANILKRLKKFTEAKILMERTLHSSLIYYNEYHPKVTYYRATLALIYFKLNEFEKARDLLEISVSSYLKIFPKINRSILAYQDKLADSYIELGQYKKAFELLSSIKSSMGSVPSIEHLIDHSEIESKLTKIQKILKTK